VPKLSVTVITHDESTNIDAALESAAWADEIVVVDSGSTDDTVERARRHGARVLHREWDGYGAQKNFAAAQVSHDWVLVLDADERITPELAAEMRALLASDPPHAGYRMPRVTNYLGKWIRTTDWYPNLQLRLYDRRRARWSMRPVHESLIVDGSVGVLRHELLHFPYRDVSDHLRKIDRYTSLAAQHMLQQNQKGGVASIVVYPPAAFLRNYVARGGFRQGSTGLIISALNSYYVLLKFVKLWELRRRR
jgi:glycosyltransferase involved in cell wall biosynthesis